MKSPTYITWTVLSPSLSLVLLIIPMDSNLIPVINSTLRGAYHMWHLETLGNLVALINFVLYKKSVVFSVYTLVQLLSSFVSNYFFKTLTIYWLFFYWSVFLHKKEPTGRIAQSHLYFMWGGFGPYFTLHIYYTLYLLIFPFPIPPTSITMASSTQSMMNLDPEHISCIGGRTVVTCKGCAGNAPR